MKKVTYEFAREKNELKRKIEEAQIVFQSLLDQSNKLDLVKINAMADLISIAQNGEIGIKNIFENQLQPQFVGNLQLKPSAVLDHIDWPNMDLLQLASEFARDQIQYSGYLKLSMDKVLIDQGKMDDGISAHQLTATSKDQIDAVENLRKLGGLLNDIHATLVKSGYRGLDGYLKLQYYFHYIEGCWIINENFLRELQREWRAIDDKK